MEQIKINDYGNAFVELTEIIKYMNEEIRNKIPISIRLAMQEACNKNYNFKYDETLPLYEQKILPETKALLSVLYSDYLCSEDQKEKWKRYDEFCLNKEEEAKRRKNHPDNVFKNKEERIIPIENEQNSQETAIIEYKESIFTRIKNWFKRLFS